MSWPGCIKSRMGSCLWQWHWKDHGGHSQDLRGQVLLHLQQKGFWCPGQSTGENKEAQTETYCQSYQTSISNPLRDYERHYPKTGFSCNSNSPLQIWHKYELISKKFYLLILILFNVQGICLHVLYLKLVFLSLYVFHIIWIFFWIFKIVDI